MAVAGYTNCHMYSTPYSFDALGIDVVPEVERFIGAAFIIDVPRLTKGGTMYPLVLTAAARLVAAYPSLQKDVKDTDGWEIVTKIRAAANKASIDDPSVPEGVGQRWHVVLMEWARRIEADFQAKNVETPPPSKKASTDSQIAYLTSRVEQTDKTVEELKHMVTKLLPVGDALETMATSYEMLQQQHREKDQQIHQKDLLIEKLTNKCNRQQRMLCAVQSPTRGSTTASVEGAAFEDQSLASVPLSRRSSDGTDSEQAPKRVRLSSDVAALPGAQKAPPPATAAAQWRGVLPGDTGTEQKVEVGGITVTCELERLMTNDLLKKKADLSEGAVEKSILFNKKHDLFVGHNPVFTAAKDEARYRKGMTVVAMGIENGDWKLMLEGGDPTSRESRELFKRVEESAKDKALALERQTELRRPDQEFNGGSTIHSLGERFNKIRKAWKDKLSKSDEEIEAIIKRATSSGGNNQRFLTGYFQSGNS